MMLVEAEDVGSNASIALTRGVMAPTSSPRLTATLPSSQLLPTSAGTLSQTMPSPWTTLHLPVTRLIPVSIVNPAPTQALQSIRLSCGFRHILGMFLSNHLSQLSHIITFCNDAIASPVVNSQGQGSQFPPSLKKNPETRGRFSIPH